MSNYSDRYTAEQRKKLEKRIISEYSRAYRELDEKYHQYLYGYDEMVGGKVVHHKGLEERIEIERKAYEAGKYTDQQWKNYLLAQAGRGERWKALRDKMADRIAHANEVAAAYINDATPSIYSINANYQAYEIAQTTGADFTIYNEQAVKRLIMDENHSQFQVRTNRKRDYEWNTGQIQSAITAGILQGKSLPDIVDNFMTVMKRNRAAAVRNARTSITSAQNGGRMDSLDRASKMGIKVQKEWIATLDTRTRDSHQHLDGEVVDKDKPFSNGLMYPADPDGEPREVYNCRCAMRGVLPDYPYKGKRENYDQWAGRMKANYAKGDSRFVDGMMKVIEPEEWIYGNFVLYGSDTNKRYGRFYPEDVYEQMLTSKMGRECLKFAESDDIMLYMHCDPQMHSNKGSDTFADGVVVYTTNIRNEKEASQIAVHEIIHKHYGIGGCQYAECVCRACEKMHILGVDSITDNEWDEIVKQVKIDYDTEPWELEEGYAEKFKFIIGR